MTFQMQTVAMLVSEEIVVFKPWPKCKIKHLLSAEVSAMFACNMAIFDKLIINPHNK